MQESAYRWIGGSNTVVVPFFRKGEIGDWRNHFNEEQSKSIDLKVEEYPLMKKIWSKDM